MCGIAGFWGGLFPEAAASVLQAMTSQIQHRGPDSSGEWLDADSGIALGHRRLAVIDLTAAGAQPLISHDGRYVVTYNGEIYNHLELRMQLEQAGRTIHWRGRSDTETLACALAHWGVESTLRRLNGMFAFAAWDRRTRTLHLARDRLGEKPLYFGHGGGAFLFGSELRAIAAFPGWDRKICPGALTLFFRHGYIPAPHSIYSGMLKLLPGHHLTVTNPNAPLPRPVPYWSVDEVLSRASSSKPGPHPLAIQEELDGLLRQAVSSRMESDVPLGAFLSGGIDSSTIVALMQEQSMQKIKTFSIGFEDARFNEQVHARRVATHLGTDHTDLCLRAEDALALVPTVHEYWDEPFADSSQLPTLLVSRLARTKVTVSLSGDGGDELFCGYSRYTQGARLWKAMRFFPSHVRRPVGGLARYVPSLLAPFGSNVPRNLLLGGDRAGKLGEILQHSDRHTFYQVMNSHLRRPEELVIGGFEPPTELSQSDKWPRFSDTRDRMMYLDLKGYLPDDILTKVDRASMAFSLESRVPLLDHRVVEFAARLPVSFKVRDGQSKWPLRQVLHRHVPKALVERPKMGFAVPIESWLRGPLRSWAEDMLHPDRLAASGLLNPIPIQRMWREHLSGTRRWHYPLWDVLMFQGWLQRERQA